MWEVEQKDWFPKWKLDLVLGKGSSTQLVTTKKVGWVDWL